MTKVLNLYAGIGGNRKLWDDVDVTAVEKDSEIAMVYKHHFPKDKVIVADAHQYLKDHYDKFDFVWSSVPCPTHSQVSRMTWTSDAPQNKDREPEYPDMRLYQEVIFLRHFAECDWVVENVQSYYQPLINPQTVGRHYIWSNIQIPPFETDGGPAAWTNPPNRVFEDFLGFGLDGIQFTNYRKDKVLRNCVDPELGKHILDATRNRQQTLSEVEP